VTRLRRHHRVHHRQDVYNRRRFQRLHLPTVSCPDGPSARAAGVSPTSTRTPVLSDARELCTYRAAVGHMAQPSLSTRCSAWSKVHWPGMDGPRMTAGSQPTVVSMEGEHRKLDLHYMPASGFMARGRPGTTTRAPAGLARLAFHAHGQPRGNCCLGLPASVVTCRASPQRGERRR
jgi:hypothetical protein